MIIVYRRTEEKFWNAFAFGKRKILFLFSINFILTKLKIIAFILQNPDEAKLSAKLSISKDMFLYKNFKMKRIKNICQTPFIFCLHFAFKVFV